MVNYSLLIMGEGDGDEDGSGGNSPSRQGAGTETSVPRNGVLDGGGALELFWGNRRLSCEF